MELSKAAIQQGKAGFIQPFYLARSKISSF
jgi:hypothetical protein